MRDALDPADALDAWADALDAPADAFDAEDAFGHPAIVDPDRDDAEWQDGDEDDIDV